MPSAAEPVAGPTSKVSDVITTFRPTRLFKAPPASSFTSIDFDDSGEFLLLARTDDTIHLYNTKAGAHAKELKSQKYGNALARFTHHSTSIIYASTKVDDGIRYLSMHDNTFIRYFRGHTGRVTSLTVSPSNDTFLSASLDNTVRLWDARSPNPQGQLNFESPYLAAFDPSATVIAIASPAAQSIVLYDVRQYDKPPFATFDLAPHETRFTHPPTHHRPAQGWTGLEFSNHGKTMLLSTSGPGHFLLDAYSGDLTHYLTRAHPTTPPSHPDPTHLAPGDTLPPPAEGATPSYVQTSASFSPDGRYVIGGNSPGAGLLVWDTEDGNGGPANGGGGGVLEPTAELPSQKAAKVVMYNPRHNLVASADREMMLWLPDVDLA